MSGDQFIKLDAIEFTVPVCVRLSAVMAVFDVEDRKGNSKGVKYMVVLRSGQNVFCTDIDTQLKSVLPFLAPRKPAIADGLKVPENLGPAEEADSAGE